MPQYHIVHVAHIGRSVQCLPHMVVSVCHIVIGKMLARQVADGQPTPRSRPVAVDDAPEKTKQCRIFEAAG